VRLRISVGDANLKARPICFGLKSRQTVLVLKKCQSAVFSPKVFVPYLVTVAIDDIVTVGVVHFVEVTVFTVLTVCVVCEALMPKTLEQYLEAPGEILRACTTRLTALQSTFRTWRSSVGTATAKPRSSEKLRSIVSKLGMNKSELRNYS
jgi:hypothetical protein